MIALIFAIAIAIILAPILKDIFEFAIKAVGILIIIAIFLAIIGSFM